MPIEFALWRVGDIPTRVEPSRLPDEAMLERFLEQDVALLGLDVLVLGRQLITAYGKRVDLLAIDREGSIYVIELKRDRTPREVVAQALDYGAWVKSLTYEHIAEVSLQRSGKRLEEAFADRFGVALPDPINQEHHLVIVASELDASTERIVGYLSAEYGARINVIFFRYFVDEGRAYIARSWLIDPGQAEANTAATGRRGREPWNGTDFYVSFGDGEHRAWDDARTYGFVSGGGGRWYSRTLDLLQPGHRVFVCIPQQGYVGVGEVVAPAVRVSEFEVHVDGKDVPILEAPLKASDMGRFVDDPDRDEYLVRVSWTKAVPSEQAVWEKGMFANQNTACALRSSFTSERVMTRFGLDQ